MILKKKLLKYKPKLKPCTHISDIKWAGGTGLIKELNDEIDIKYLEKIKNLSFRDQSHSNLKIVFTALHGTSITLLPKALKNLGFQHVVIFAFLSLTGWCYLRFMWVKASQHLRLGIQQVCTSQAFLKKRLKTTNQYLTHIFPPSYLPSSSCPGC